MNPVGKSLQNLSKTLSRRVKQRQNEVKTVKVHNIPIRFVQPNIPVEDPALTKAMKTEIEKEFLAISHKTRFLTPDKMLEQIDFSFESFFSKRELNLSNFNKLLQVFSQHGKIDEALGAIEKMKILSITPDHNSFVQLIIGSGRSKDTETAELLFTKATQELGEATGILYTSLISAYAQSVNPSSILRLINEKRAKGFKVTEIDYTCYMNALIKNKQAPEAIQVYESHSHEVNTDEYLLAMVLTACSKTNSAEYALNIWQRLKSMGFPQVSYFYNEIIMALAKRKDYAEKAIEIYKQMRGEGVIPDTRTFNGALTACSRLGDLPEARFMLMEMKSFGVELDKTKAGLVMSVYSEACLDANEDAKDLFIKESWDMLRLCQEIGWVDQVVLNSLLSVHTKAVLENQVEGMVIPLYDQMGIKKDVYTYRHLMKMYAELADYKSVKSLWVSMNKEGVVPDMYVLNGYLKACMETKDTDECCVALERFKKLDYTPLYMYLKQMIKTENLPMRLWAHLQDFDHFDKKNFDKHFRNRVRIERIEKRYTK